MLVLGVDPGTAITGYGLVRQEGSRLYAEHYGVIKTPPDWEAAQRLLAIHEKLSSLIDQYRPNAAAIEELFFNRNAKTVMTVSQARGAVILTAALKQLELYEYTPLQIKQAVAGYGLADKKQVQEMVRRLLGMEKLVKPDDAADALAVAICHAHSWRMGRKLR